jgi:glycosyltransferase involved in cell wall biosynthesis
MNIAIVLPYLKAGGTERQASYIANYLSEAGHNVNVFCIEKNDIMQKEFDVPVKYLHSKNSTLKILINVNLLGKSLKKFRADIVISRAWSTNTITTAPAMRLGIPSVIFLSGSIDLSGHTFFKKKIHQYFVNKATHIISVSHKAKENCIKWLKTDGDKISVVHNGIDVYKITEYSEETELLPKILLKNQTVNIVFVGRLIHRKGLDILLNSISEIIKNGRKLHLTVIGDGDKKQEYFTQIKLLDIAENVTFVGEQKNPFPFMSKADIFVLPSRSEGFPNVLLEAMALSIPVIAANCETGPAEILNDENGLLAVPGSVSSFVEKIEQLIMDHRLRIEMGAKGKETVINGFQLRNQLSCIEETVNNAYNNFD